MDTEHFANAPGIIGYDMLNEPGVDGPQLSALYEDVAKRIRKNHPDAILFVSASLFTFQASASGSNSRTPPCILQVTRVPANQLPPYTTPSCPDLIAQFRWICLVTPCT